VAVHKLLSPGRIKAAEAAHHATWLSDDHGSRGSGRLVLRVTPGSQSRWYYRMPRSHGSPSPIIPLGLYSFRRRAGALTLTEARERANAIVLELLRTKLEAPARPSSGAVAVSGAPAPTHVVTQQESPPAPPAPDSTAGVTLVEICRAYARSLADANKPSSREVGRTFERLIAPSPLAQRQAREIKPREFTEFLRAVISKHGRETGKKLRSFLSTAYRHAIDASTSLKVLNPQVGYELSFNPLAEIRPPMGQTVRERVLKVSEFRKVWDALSAPARLEDVRYCAVRLAVLLGGQRCQQLLRVKVLNVDLDAATIRLFDGKGNRETPRLHLLPLLPRARDEVLWLIKHSKSLESEWLLAAERSHHALHPSVVSTVVRKIYLSIRKTEAPEEQFQFSDLRRTVESYLAALGVTEKVRAHLQSHGLSGVQHVHYDKYEYMTEKREALKQWESFIFSPDDSPGNWPKRSTES